SILPRMLPLPDGLHFTPATSARVMLAGDLRLVEIDMPYQERTGRSKLHVLRDGARFFRIIGETAFLFRPGRLLWTAALVAAVGSAVFVSGPLIYYARHSMLQDWMIYRCAAAALLALASVLLLSGGYLATRVTDVAIFHRDSPGLQGKGRALVGRAAFLLIPTALVLGSIALAWSGFSDYLSTGHVHTHWSRILAIFSLLAIALVLFVLKILDAALSLVHQRVDYLTRARARAAERSTAATAGDSATAVSTGMDVVA